MPFQNQNCRPVRSRKAFFASTRPWPLESESIALVDTLGEELPAPNSTVPATWGIADRSAHRHGRPWWHCEF